MTTRTVIEVESLVKRYGSNLAVEDVSFEVRQGEIFGLLGPNGAGKTTTVECLQGLRRADGGHLRVLGLDPHEQTGEPRRRIGSQLQESALPDRIKVVGSARSVLLRGARRAGVANCDAAMGLEERRAVPSRDRRTGDSRWGVDPRRRARLGQGAHCNRQRRGFGAGVRCGE